IVGNGADRKWLDQEVSKLKLESRVHVVGSVLHENLPEYFSAADLFCLPSYREGVPNVLMEAMSSGKPCVASNVDGIPEVLADFCGVMPPPQNTDALTTAIELALSCNWDSSRIRSHASQYSWEATGDKYAEVIYQTLQHVACKRRIRN
ncbi:MAG: glycosyltransferase, partial [Actinobacteria bacterium]|nr:glycosyltransferase [Actinomycetota bacterium]